MLKMDLEYNNGILFVRLDGILMVKNCYKINNYINPVLQKHKIKYLVYNLNSLQNIDESGINVILHSKIEMKKNKGKIVLCAMNEKIEQKVKRLRIPKIENESVAFQLIEVR